MKKKRIISVIATMLCMVMLFTLPCDAAKYGYTTVVKIENKTVDKMKFNSMQGMAIGSQYAYTAKLPDGKNLKEEYARIVRTDVTTKEEKVLTCNGKEYVTKLGHANDMCVTSISGKSNLFVAASYVETKNKTQEYNLVKLTVTGTTVKHTGKYKVKKPNGSYLYFSGVTIYKHPGKSNNNTITFLFKEKNSIYVGKIKANATTATITTKLAFTFQKNYTKSNGVHVDYSSYSNQGFSYYNDRLYIPISGNGSDKGKSVILTYNNINNNLDKNKFKHLVPDRNLVFEISDKNYSKMLEIESCGICTQKDNYKLYFNTNRRKADDTYDWDDIHYANGYKAK